LCDDAVVRVKQALEHAPPGVIRRYQIRAGTNDIEVVRVVAQREQLRANRVRGDALRRVGRTDNDALEVICDVLRQNLDGLFCIRPLDLIHPEKLFPRLPGLDDRPRRVADDGLGLGADVVQIIFVHPSSRAA